MSDSINIKNLNEKYIQEGDHGSSDYFGLIKELVSLRNRNEPGSRKFILWQDEINRTYELVRDELINNQEKPIAPVKFGTSGWRGILGKELSVKSVRQVTRAIIAVYHEAEKKSLLKI